MIVKKLSLALLFGFYFITITTSIYSEKPMTNLKVTKIKSQILALAKEFQGQGDPDRSKQRKLEEFVEQLLVESPQLPVKERLKLIEGAWHQVWGPYDYSSSNRGVESSIDVNRIYQVVFNGGYYYNINPNPEKKELSIGLLRGEYEVDEKRKDVLNVKFTKFNSVTGCLSPEIQFTDLPSLSEKGELKNESWYVPRWIVSIFFGRGSLHEVYTDSDLRITYGSSRNNLDDNYIYILTRVTNSSIEECQGKF